MVRNNLASCKYSYFFYREKPLLCWGVDHEMFILSKARSNDSSEYCILDCHLASLICWFKYWGMLGYVPKDLIYENCFGWKYSAK